MKTETVVRQINEVARPDSVTLKLLANGTYGFEIKAYGDLTTKEGAQLLNDALVNEDKAIRTVFPCAEVKVPDEIKYLKGRVAELENENADERKAELAAEARSEGRAERDAEARD